MRSSVRGWSGSSARSGLADTLALPFGTAMKVFERVEVHSRVERTLDRERLRKSVCQR
jgi:hypothetical protein